MGKIVQWAKTVFTNWKHIIVQLYAAQIHTKSMKTDHWTQADRELVLETQNRTCLCPLLYTQFAIILKLSDIKRENKNLSSYYI